ncbi:MAG: hypothetical protein JO155_07945, partial [Acidimicrobiia bacterium]|nr:hypothetical protein [Acidimicrobiia bacterium]
MGDLLDPKRFDRHAQRLFLLGSIEFVVVLVSELRPELSPDHNLSTPQLANNRIINRLVNGSLECAKDHAELDPAERDLVGPLSESVGHCAVP